MYHYISKTGMATYCSFMLKPSSFGRYLYQLLRTKKYRHVAKRKLAELLVFSDWICVALPLPAALTLTGIGTTRNLSQLPLEHVLPTLRTIQTFTQISKRSGGISLVRSSHTLFHYHVLQLLVVWVQKLTN